MSPAIRGGLIGAFAGFVALLAVGVFQLQSRPLVEALWPTRFLITASNGFGPTGEMIFRTLAFLTNVLLFAAVGYAIGWMVSPRRTKP